MRNRIYLCIFYISLSCLIGLNYFWFQNTWLAGQFFGLQSEPTINPDDQKTLKAYFPFRYDMIDHSKGKNIFTIKQAAVENISNGSNWLHLPAAQDLKFAPQLVQAKRFGLVGLGTNNMLGGASLGSTDHIDISEGEWSNGVSIAGVFITEKPIKFSDLSNYYGIAGLYDAKGPLLSLQINLPSSVFNYQVISSSSSFHSFPNDIDWERPIYFVLIIDNKIGKTRMYLNGKLVLDQAATFRPISGPVTLQVGKKEIETYSQYLRFIQELSIWSEPLTNDQAVNLSKNVLTSHADASRAIQKVNGLMLILIVLSFLGCLVCNPFYPSKRSGSEGARN